MKWIKHIKKPKLKLNHPLMILMKLILLNKILKKKRSKL